MRTDALEKALAQEIAFAASGYSGRELRRVLQRFGKGPIATRGDAPRQETSIVEPAGRRRTLRYSVKGSGTDPQSRKPTVPAGSGRESIPPPARSADTWDANRKVPPSSA